MKNKMKITFLSLSENEAFSRSVIASFLLPLNPTVSEISDIKTAVSEAVTNCVVHAYPKKPGMVTLDVVLYDDYVDISVSDSGVGIFDIKKAREPFYTTNKTGERSGMGFTVMESFMSNIDVIKNQHGGITVNMKKYLSKDQALEGWKKV